MSRRLKARWKSAWLRPTGCRKFEAFRPAIGTKSDKMKRHAHAAMLSVVDWCNRQTDRKTAISVMHCDIDMEMELRPSCERHSEITSSEHSRFCLTNQRRHANQDGSKSPVTWCKFQYVSMQLLTLDKPDMCGVRAIRKYGKASVFGTVPVFCMLLKHCIWLNKQRLFQY